MKREIIREIVYKTRTRRKFIIQTIKSWKNTIQMIIGVYILDPCALFWDKLTSGYIVRDSLFKVMFI